MKRLVVQDSCLHGYFGVCTFLVDGQPCEGGTK